jgi:hypothetical protein
MKALKIALYVGCAILGATLIGQLVEAAHVGF